MRITGCLALTLLLGACDDSGETTDSSPTKDAAPATDLRRGDGGAADSAAGDRDSGIEPDLSSTEAGMADLATMADGGLVADGAADLAAAVDLGVAVDATAIPPDLKVADLVSPADLVCQTGSVCATSCKSTGMTVCWPTGRTCAPPPTETACGDKIDDDCDGKIDGADPECQVTCNQTDGGNCNTDIGAGDKCDAKFNTGGCSKEKFWAWCNRRNPRYPNIWDSYKSTWVATHCGGAVGLDKTTGRYYCIAADGRQYLC